MTQNNDPVVQAVGLTKTFRDFWHREKVCAVRELDLSVLPHQVFGLLGPNGSGKSTTIKMILGLLYPSKGYIRVFDRPPTDVSIKAKIGFLPEESYLYPFLDARETLDYYGRLFRQARPERRRRVDMLLEMVGLAAVASRRVGEYSKGMQRRIGLAQALINDPDLLILDEPTSGMDPLGTRQFKDLIVELGRRGKTIILSSHLLADVEDVCDRVVILYGGRIRAEGSVGDLLCQNGLTQITTERLSDSTVQKIRRLVAAEDRSILEVSSPKDRLETVFLRIVEQARSERLSTGGAVATGELAQFLRADGEEGHAVIDKLVAVGAPAQPFEVEQAVDTAPADAEVRQSVLSELSSATGQPSAPAAEPAPPPAQPTDRSVIDSLLDGPAKSRKE